MKKSLRFIALGGILALSIPAFLALSENTKSASAYSASSLPTTIDLNDTSASNIRSYYSSLNNLSESERQGTNLLKNLKTILKNGQKYYSYENGENVWKMYEITDRDWDKSPASGISGYNPSTKKITGYSYNTTDPYVHALYINRDVDNKTTAWSDHQQTQWGINREHVWPKAEGFDSSGAGGARGDPRHLMAGNGYANNIHSNYYYGYVKTSGDYTDCGTKYSNLSGNLKGTSKTLNSGTVFEPQDCDKGDIARSIFYMVARYNYYSGSDSDGIDTNNPNLALTQNIGDWSSSGYTSSTSKQGKMGIMTDLLAWHKADPVDEYEIHRNNLLYTNFTNNRNPFIDFPEWANFIWGSVSYNGSSYVSHSTTPTGSAAPNSDTINGYNSGGGEVVAVTGVSLNKNSTSITIGGAETLEATIAPSNATNQGVSWSSSNTSIATVSNGTVRGVAEGSATITVTTSDGGFTATCTVTVTASGGGGGGDSGSATISYSDTFSPTFPTSSATVNTSPTSHTDSTSNFVFKEQGIYKNASNYLMFVENKGFLYNTTDLGTIDSVSVTYSNGTSTSGKVGVYFGSSEQSTYTTSSNQTIKGQSQTDVFNNSTSGNGYFQLSTSNKNVQITTIEVAYHTESSTKTLDSITLDTSDAPTTFNVGDTFSYEGLSVTANYDDGSSDIVAPTSVSTPNMSTAGQKTVTVTYTEGGVTKTATYTITVNAVTLTSIEVSNAKTAYYVGDTFVKPTVTATYSNGSTSDVTNSATFSGYNLSNAGNQTVTVSYGGQSTTYQINVSESGGATDTTQYSLITSTSDLEAGKSYIITNGTSNSVAALSTETNGNNRRSTTTTVSSSKITRGSSIMSLTLGGTTGAWTFKTENYTSTNGYLTPGSSISGARLFVNSTNDEYGLFTISFSDSKAVITSTGKSTYNVLRCNPNSGNPLFACYTSGQNDIYLWKETVSKTLTSISLDTTNVQKTFTIGDSFNYTGLVVTAHYSDSSSATVIPTSVSSPNMSSAGNKTVTVTYTENGVSKTDSYSITVNSNPSLSWTAPTINVYSGTTLSGTDVDGWSVTYNDGAGHLTVLTYSQVSVKLGGSTISIPYTWNAADDGKTLCVSYSSLTTATTTVRITQTINNVYKEIPAETLTSNLTFTAACGGSGTADDGKTWNVTSDGTESSHDSNKGIHYGTSSAAVQYIKLTSTAFNSGTITKVVVQGSTASGVSATVSVKVGGSAFGGNAQSLTTSNASYTFNGEASSGTIEVLITKPSSATKAIYCKGIAVTYSTSSSSQNIANSLDHIAAQRAAVKFAKAFNAAMDTTSSCTTNLSSAWSTCQSAYNTFKSEAAALGSTEEAYAKDLIKYATAQYSDDSGEACIERMMKTYEVCVQKHGQTAFMDELITLSRPTNTNPITIIGSKTDTNTLIIVVITSVMSLTAIGGYFFLRKRKEQ